MAQIGENPLDPITSDLLTDAYGSGELCRSAGHAYIDHSPICWLILLQGEERGPAVCCNILSELALCGRSQPRPYGKVSGVVLATVPSPAEAGWRRFPVNTCPVGVVGVALLASDGVAERLASFSAG